MIVKDGEYIYQIPEPVELVNTLSSTASPLSITKINGTNVLDKMTEESKLFFIEKRD